MKCVSCGTVIPPEWKAAIKNNKCPACDGFIMNDNMQELLVELRTALAAMPNDAEGIAGWLLSHYQLVKVGTGEPVAEFFGEKKKTKEPSTEGLKVAPNSLNKFYNRANLKTPEQYSQLAKKLDIGEGVDYGDEDSSIEVSEESDDDLDPIEKAKILSAMQGPSSSPITKKQMRSVNKVGQEVDLANSDDIHPALLEDRMKRLQTQQDIACGIKKGSFARG